MTDSPDPSTAPTCALTGPDLAGGVAVISGAGDGIGRDGIRVNVVVPGYTRGAPLDQLFDAMAERRGVDRASVEAEIVGATALRRIPDPEDIAEAVRYLASPRSACVTGVSIDVNGGQWLP